ncbi:hypothetical protein [Luteitalea sp.]|uniref:hypothetical protein n=1 Tax=Luteitalea sp. TaxID=2004800 RepID=UPI0025BF0A3D|nr:hypothetical protein [Luteitalea sp.]
MRRPAAWRAEARQFRLLVGVSYRRLLDAALASRDVDAEQFALWGAALLATPPLYAAMIWPSRYPWLRRQGLDVLHTAVVSDRLFFVAWSLLVAVLVGALLWDALFPDRTDQQVLGVLPVRSRTVAAARLAAALTTVAVLLVAINLPAASLTALSGAVDPSVGRVPGIFLGQMVATVTAGICAFSTLLVMRGAAAWLLGATVASRIAVALQFVSVLATFLGLMFLPGLLAVMMRQVPAGTGVPLPPVWFMGLYAWFAGPYATVLAPLGVWASGALAASVTLALAVYVLPARLAARRAIEARDGGQGAQRLLAPLLAAGAVLRRPSARARYAFAVLSLTRSRRHLLIVASYLALGVALGGVRVLSQGVRGRLSVDQPAAFLVVIPLVLIFFLVLGLRAAFAVPTDLAANWAFRIVGPRSVLESRSAARLAFYTVAVFPVVGLAVAVAGWQWGTGVGLRLGAMHLAAGVMLTEVALQGHESVPFTKSRALSTSSLKVGVALAIGLIYFVAFRFDGLQLWALATPSRAAAYVVSLLLAAVFVAVTGRHRSRSELATFDAPDDHAVTQLKLSEASL